MSFLLESLYTLLCVQISLPSFCTNADRAALRVCMPNRVPKLCGKDFSCPYQLAKPPALPEEFVDDEMLPGGRINHPQNGTPET